jgi:hypothetical protein
LEYQHVILHAFTANGHQLAMAALCTVTSVILSNPLILAYGYKATVENTGFHRPAQCVLWVLPAAGAFSLAVSWCNTNLYNNAVILVTILLRSAWNKFEHLQSGDFLAQRNGHVG